MGGVGVNQPRGRSADTRSRCEIVHRAGIAREYEARVLNVRTRRWANGDNAGR